MLGVVLGAALAAVSPIALADDAPGQGPDAAQGPSGADPGDVQNGNGTEDSDPPDRVARLSLTQGSVSLQPAGSEEWAGADVNRPLTTGDRLWTDQDSRAELDIGSAAIRLGSTTGFSFLNLDDHTTQMQLTAGTAIVRVRSLGQGEDFEVDTPNLAVSLLEPGQYRVEVNEAGDTTIVEVAEGDAQAAGESQGYPIHAQQKAVFTGTEQLSSVISTLGAPDELDRWSLARDREQQSARSQQYVSEETTGYADLDRNGTWEDTPDYGYVWTPTTVVAGWTPYRFGHWIWITPWGWTWVDDAPWGFAPFHYGRWVNRRNAWCWVPGPRRIRPVYAPALVAWVGNPGVGVSVSIGAGVGWFPLGPRDVYVPSYRVSSVYVQRVNLANSRRLDSTYIVNTYRNRNTQITYMNRNVRGAVTAVPRSVFTSAQPVWRNRMNVPEAQLQRLGARATVPSIIPVRQSLVGASARVNVRQPPARFMDRRVVVRTAPPRGPVPFERQSEAIRANGGRPLDRTELDRLQPRTPAATVHVLTPGRVRPGGVGPGAGAGPGALRPGVRPSERNAPNDSAAAMAERERALRESRQNGSARGERPPVAPPQGTTPVRPPERGTFTPSEVAPRPNRAPVREYRTQPGQDFDPGDRGSSEPNQRRFDRPPPAQIRPVQPEQPPAVAPAPRIERAPPQMRQAPAREPPSAPAPREPRAAPQIRQPPPAAPRAQPRAPAERPSRPERTERAPPAAVKPQ